MGLGFLEEFRESRVEALGFRVFSFFFPLSHAVSETQTEDLQAQLEMQRLLALKVPGDLDEPRGLGFRV